MLSLPGANWWRLGVWLLIDLVVYFAYSRHHSHLGKELRRQIAAVGISPAVDGSEAGKRRAQQ